MRRSLSRSLSTRGSKLMFRSSRWHPSRLVRASIAPLGLAIIGTVLVSAGGSDAIFSKLSRR